jgi:hypothetical protein
VEEVTQDPHLLVMERFVVGVTAGVPEGATGMFMFLYLIIWLPWLLSAIYVAWFICCDVHLSELKVHD